MQHYTFRFPMKRVQVFDLDQGYDVPKYVWLRKSLKLLGLLKRSVYFHRYDSYETVTISSTRMKDLIHQYLHETMRTNFQSPTKIYVGHAGYSQLMDETYADKISEPVSWPWKVLGIEIVLTPFLDGVKFLPVFD